MLFQFLRIPSFALSFYSFAHFYKYINVKTITFNSLEFNQVLGLTTNACGCTTSSVYSFGACCETSFYNISDKIGELCVPVYPFYNIIDKVGGLLVLRNGLLLNAC